MGDSRRPRRVLAALTVVAVIATACGVSPAKLGADRAAVPTTTGRASPSGTGTVVAGTIAWSDCGGGFQCGRLEVPLDWFHDDGRRISLAVIRKPASSASARIGSLFLNPGGPGEPGQDFLRSFAPSNALRALNRRFDLVSWDPRGVGASDGIHCLDDAQELAPAPDPAPTDAAGRKALVHEIETSTAACERNSATILPFAGTRETVHDLDALRVAVGDPKLTYVGFSYGTAIGVQYLRELGTRVRAMVLDGVVIPGSDPVASAHDQIRSFETNLDAFLDDCAARADCTFGKPDPRAALHDLIDRMRHGLRLPADYTTTDDAGHQHVRRGTLGIGEIFTAIITPLYSRDTWPLLEEGLTAATRRTDPNGYLLLSLRDQLEGRGDDGTWDHISDANEAISCADQSERAKSALGDPALTARWAAEMPFLGAVQATGQPGCFDWPAARYPLVKPTAAELAGSPPVVVVNSSRDPATPYADAVSLVGLLPGASLVTWDSADHTSFGRDHSCVDDPVVAYLETGARPAAGLTCRP